MTTDELRALDARVHREVMGRPCHFDSGPWFEDESTWENGTRRWASVPPYSSEIAAAWLVVEKLSGMGHGLVLQDWTYKGSAAWAALYDLANAHDTGHIMNESAPVAICLAALRAVQVPGGGAKVVACPTPCQT